MQRLSFNSGLMFTIVSLMSFTTLPDCKLEYEAIDAIMEGLAEQGMENIYADPTLASKKIRGFEHYVDKYDLKAVSGSEGKTISLNGTENYSILKKGDFAAWKKNNRGYFIVQFSSVQNKGDEYFILTYVLTSSKEQIQELYSFKLSKNCALTDLKVVDGYFKWHCPK